MPTFEGLRRERAEAEEAAARQATQNNERLAREAAEQKGKDEAARAEAEKMTAKARALSSSAVPALAEELADLIKGNFWYGRSTKGTVAFERTEEHSRQRSGGFFNGATTDTYVHREKFIDIEGQVDGSVKIGSRMLSAREARDPKIVERALESALNTPRIETETNIRTVTDRERREQERQQQRERERDTEPLGGHSHT